MTAPTNNGATICERAQRCPGGLSARMVQNESGES